MTEYLTPQDVIKAAKESEKAAIICSIKHWEQIVEAPREDLKQCPMGSSLCALCVRAEDCCGDCPLKNCLTVGSNYDEASHARYDLQEGTITIDEFHERCRPLLEQLKDLLL